MRAAASPMFSSRRSALAPRRSARLIERDMPILTWLAKSNDWIPGIKSQSNRICASHRDAIISTNLSRGSSGPFSFLRRDSFRGKSGPPTHHGNVMLKTRGMYDASNCFSKIEPVRSDRLENCEKAFPRDPSTSLLASESRCATRICGRARSISLSNSSGVCTGLSAGVAALFVVLSTPINGSSGSSCSMISITSLGMYGSLGSSVGANSRARSSISSKLPR